MPMSQKTIHPPGSTRADIRRLAVILTPVIWCICLGMGLHYGKTVPQAISTATAASLAGLASWFAYHLVSRQNNGVLMVMFPGVNLYSRTYVPSWPTFCYSFLVYVAIACFIGLTARVLTRKKPTPVLSEPMYDPQVDRSA